MGHDWDGRSPAGWIASEKMDGCRALWDGRNFWSRNGRKISAPDWFKAGLPDTRLDGEIWAGRGGFNRASQAVRFGTFTENLRFGIFDFPERCGNWIQRIGESVETRFAFTVKPVLVFGFRHLAELLMPVLEQGGEGLIIRNPSITTYETGRTENFLKVKSMTDELWNEIV